MRSPVQVPPACRATRRGRVRVLRLPAEQLQTEASFLYMVVAECFLSSSLTMTKTAAVDVAEHYAATRGAARPCRAPANLLQRGQDLFALVCRVPEQPARPSPRAATLAYSIEASPH